MGFVLGELDMSKDEPTSTGQCRPLICEAQKNTAVALQ
jgi:hypothetical protein